AAAGDSVARKSALDELAARRAALDSAFADSIGGAAGTVRAPMTRADSAKADSARRARADSARLRPPTVPPAPRSSGPPPAAESR
ncbi:MAG: hypothetical protein ABMA00_13955, partial [Gemmatimonas sp.]